MKKSISPKIPLSLLPAWPTSGPPLPICASAYSLSPPTLIPPWERCPFMSSPVLAAPALIPLDHCLQHIDAASFQSSMERRCMPGYNSHGSVSCNGSFVKTSKLAWTHQSMTILWWLIPQSRVEITLMLC